MDATTENIEVQSNDTEQKPEPSMQDALFGKDAVPTVDEAEKTEAALPSDAEAPSDGSAEVVPEKEPQAEAGSEDDYTPPEGLSAKASERFQRLANENKQYKEFGTPEQLQSMRDDAQTLDVFRGKVAESQMSPEELEGVFEYTKALKSGDFQTVEKYLEAQVKQFQMLTGKRLNADPLAQYPDIAEKMNGLELDDDTALQMAQARFIHEQQQKLIQSQQAQALQSQQQEAYENQVREQAINDVVAMSNQWKTTDILWSERAPMIQEFIQNELQGVPPNQWTGMIKAYYTALTKQVTPPRSPSPLRPNNMGAGAGNQAPTNMGEALWS